MPGLLHRGHVQGQPERGERGPDVVVHLTGESDPLFGHSRADDVLEELEVGEGDADRLHEGGDVDDVGLGQRFRGEQLQGTDRGVGRR